MTPLRKHRAALCSALSLLSLLTGCSASPPTDGDVGVANQAIANGTPSTGDHNFTVRVNISSATTGGGWGGGVLVTPSLVLVPAHVIAGINSTGDFAQISQCVLNTTPYPASAISVVVGTDWTVGEKHTVKRVFFDSSQTSCARDIAALELDQPITSVTNFPALALDTKPTEGEQVTTLGWGYSDDQFTVPSVRQEQSGTVIMAGGGAVQDPGGGGNIEIPDPYIATSTTACIGDSGGTVLDSQGNDIAMIVAATANESTSTSPCVSTDAIEIPLSYNAAFIERVFQAEKLMPHRAGQPAPGDQGAACTVNNQCNSNYCVKVGASSVCSAPCNTQADCPTALTCTDTGSGFSICLAPQTTPEGPSCSAAPQGPHEKESPAVALLAAGLLITWRRRRSSRRRSADRRN